MSLCHTLDHPVPQAPPPEQEEIDPGPNADPIVDLSTCSSVVHDERNGVPGVKFVAESHEGWTPVVKGKEKKRSLVKGDGTKSNPVRSSDAVLRLGFAKEIMAHTHNYMELQA